VIEPPAKSPKAAARIAHDLRLATCFGETIFGKVVFNSSVAVIDSKTERGRLGAAFWNSSNPIKAAAFGVAVATWFPGRLGLSSQEAERRTSNIILPRDLLIGAAASAGLAAVVARIALKRQAPQGAVPLETGGVPAPESAGKAVPLQQAVGALGSVNVAVFPGLVAVMAMLSEEADRPPRRRFFPLPLP
jgi:hypothetical protein